MVYFVDMSENALWVCFKKNCNGTNNYGIFYPCILQVHILESAFGLSLALKWGFLRRWRALMPKDSKVWFTQSKAVRVCITTKLTFFLFSLNYYRWNQNCFSFPCYLRFSFLSSKCQLAKSTTSAVKRSIYHPTQSFFCNLVSLCLFFLFYL